MNQVIDQALSILRKKSVDGYEVYLVQSSHFDVESKEGKIETLETSQYLGMAFRILHRQRMGFSYATFSNPSGSAGPKLWGALDRVIEDAVRSAAATSPDPCLDFVPSLKASLPPLPIFDETLERVSEKAKIERAKSLEAAARSVDFEKIKKVRKAAYEEVLSRTTLANSNGFQFSYDHSLVSASVTAVAEESGDSEVGWDFDFGHFFSDLNVEAVGRSAGRKALERLGGKRIPTGVYPVLLRNDVASEFLSLVAHSFFGRSGPEGEIPSKRKARRKLFFSPRHNCR